MQQLVRQRVLHVRFVHQMVLADQDAVVWVVPASLLDVARRTSDARLGGVRRKQSDVLRQEANHWT